MIATPAKGKICFPGSSYMLLAEQPHCLPLCSWCTYVGVQLPALPAHIALCGRLFLPRSSPIFPLSKQPDAKQVLTMVPLFGFAIVFRVKQQFHTNTTRDYCASLPGPAPAGQMLSSSSHNAEAAWPLPLQPDARSGCRRNLVRDATMGPGLYCQPTWTCSSRAGTRVASSFHPRLSLAPVSRLAAITFCSCMSRGPSSNRRGTPCTCYRMRLSSYVVGLIRVHHT